MILNSDTKKIIEHFIYYKLDITPDRMYGHSMDDENVIDNSKFKTLEELLEQFYNFIKEEGKL